MHDADLNTIHVLMDDVLNGTSLLFSAPQKIITAGADHADIADSFKQIEKGLDDGQWAAGFLSYELGYAFEQRLNDKQKSQNPLPLLWFGLFNEPRTLNAEQSAEWLAKNSADYSVITPPTPRISQETYVERFDVVKQMIEAGDIYQMNLTFNADFEIEGDPAALYRILRDAQPVSHGALIKTPDFSVLSLSPELFLKREGTKISTRPMKGTQSRGQTPTDDKVAHDRLKFDGKQRAENLMIVDLMRNDISRIAKVGSVKVPDLFSVETYPTLHQMTSGVEGTLIENTSFSDIMTLLFPAGSITGAPKIRAMELIHELESASRGVYCGSIGHISPNRDMNFNVAIRTAVIQANGRGEIGIGSGIVADSVADKEYSEAILKMRFLNDVMDDFQLFETMLFDRTDRFWLLDYHMARMKKSAEHFDFPFVTKDALQLLEEETSGHKHERLRVRLVLDRKGALSVTKALLPTEPSVPPESLQFIISPTRLKADDIFLKHKTTRRALYDQEFALYSDTQKAGEVVYINERGELCEGSRTNIFLEIDGELLTPPLSSGLLPGTLRAHLLETGKAKEALLTEDALNNASAIYLGNSVRGLQPAYEMEHFTHRLD
ncbi:MAG: aminodeoxychorismate synthase component I [Hyphomicrobiales bacterium]